MHPAPLGNPLEIRAQVKEVAGRKVMVTATVSAQGRVCARREVVAVKVPEHMLPDSSLKNPMGAEEREP
jgi:acyl-CoA thioesterase FadM